MGDEPQFDVIDEDSSHSVYAKGSRHVGMKHIEKKLEATSNVQQETASIDVEENREVFPIGDLPIELFWKVLSFLTMNEWGRCKSVCKFWYHSPCLV